MRGVDFPSLSLGRWARSHRGLRALPLVLALVASAADAQTSNVPAIRPTNTLPQVQNASNNFRNATGNILEQKAMKRGAIAGVAAGLAIGGVQLGIQKTESDFWGRVKAVVGGGVTGAAQGAVVGCAAGAGVSVVVGGAGCLPGAIGTGLAGGIYGAVGAYQALDEAGTASVQIGNVDAIAKAIGDNIRKNSSSSIPARSIQDVEIGTSSQPGGTIIAPSQGNGQTWASIQPPNVSYIGRDGNGRYREVISLSGTKVSYYYTSLMGGAISGTSEGSKVYLDLTKSTIGTSCSTGSECFIWARTDQGPFIQPAAYSGTAYFVNGNAGYTTPQAVPLRTFTVTQDVPNFAIGFSDKLNDQLLAMQANSKLLAGAMNEIWKAIPANAGYPAYDPSDPVTPADVAAWQAANPGRQVTVGNLLEPLGVNGNYQGGTATAPVAPAANYTQPITAPATGTGTNTGTGTSTGTDTNPTITKEKTDKDLESEIDGGLLGDIMAPAKAFMTGPLNQFFHPVITLPQAPCPTFSFDLSVMMGYPSWNGPADSSVLCDWLLDLQPLVLLLVHAVVLYTSATYVIRNA